MNNQPQETGHQELMNNQQLETRHQRNQTPSVRNRGRSQRGSRSRRRSRSWSTSRSTRGAVPHQELSCTRSCLAPGATPHQGKQTPTRAEIEVVGRVTKHKTENINKSKNGTDYNITKEEWITNRTEPKARKDIAKDKRNDTTT